MKKRERLERPEVNPKPEPLVERRDRLDNADAAEGSEGGGTSGLSNPERNRKRFVLVRGRKK